jgi:phosphoribosylamine---glycine ligase
VRVLVIGGGGREHAIVRALAADPGVSELHAAPGNPGIAALAQVHAVSAGDPPDVVRVARQVAADLVVIGPEAPLVADVAGALRAVGIAAFGPDAGAARIEGSKAFAKEVMGAAGIPTAQARVASTPAEAEEALTTFGAPYVVKDDALAAGKGVVVTEDFPAALAHAASCRRVVIEEYLDGPEVSLFAVADGRTAVPLLAAQDFKRAKDGDQGPNTGGMGAYVPLPWAPPGLADEVLATVIQPAVDEMARRGTPYRGLLYAGLALTAKGVKVVEFNARFGDPETQVVLDRLATPLAGLLHASAVGDLAAVPALAWHSGAAVTVVIAAEGYPQAPAQGDVITIVDPPAGIEGYLLHAGTSWSAPGPGGCDIQPPVTGSLPQPSAERALVTAGGRVLNAVGSGPDLVSARAAAYAVAETVRFRGAWYRRDIAERAATVA